MVRNINYKSVHYSHPTELNRAPSDLSERDHDVPGVEQEDDEKSEVTAVTAELAYSIRYSVVNSNRTINSTTRIDPSHAGASVMVGEE